ncbi:MAG: hypothetical protein SFW62_03560 [Alphaproteobacteria bacterium]|nr:hypothetical protein [Alphaproteobacteria bacterium]
MAIRDLLRNTLAVQSLSPAARTSTGTGTAVDLRGYDGAMVTVSFGAWTDGTHTPSVIHSVDGTSYSACSASDLDGSFTAVSGTAGAHAIQQVGYIGTQRFVAVLMTVGSGTTGALSSANVIAGYPRNAPTQQSV